MSHKIYIGVGHGGSDPGAVCGRHKESAYALDIANACTAELRRHGVTVMQSRADDSYESAAAKIKECNAFAPDCAADFHLNSGGGDGFEIYHSVYSCKGRGLAENIEKSVTNETGQNSRGIKIRKNSSGKDYFGFVRQTACPAVLVEFAFLDSDDVCEVDTLAKRQAMGRAAAKGILAYLGSDCISEADSEDENVSVTLPVLSRNDNGSDYRVRRVQLCLNQMGWTGADGKVLEVDGCFGTNTETAVRKLQAAHDIEPDGRMTAKTWRALLVYMK